MELAVNLSAADIVDPELLEFILEALREVKVPAGSLTLEITESVLHGRSRTRHPQHGTAARGRRALLDR